MKPKPFAFIDSHLYKYAEDEMGDDIHFHIHQKVQKCNGYLFPGIVVSIFRTLDGQIRYVVEADDPQFRGMLHIFSDNQLEARE
jgi:hypothetical protein